MKNNINTFLLFLVLSIIFSSCQFEKAIDDPNLLTHKSLLAATALISPIDSLPLIFLSKTIGITDEEPYAPIEDATVNLYKDNMLYDVYIFDSTEKYYYGAKPFFEKEGTYRLEISAPNFNSILAEQIIPSPVTILNTEVNKLAGPLINGGETDEMSITFQDDPYAENFYELMVFPIYTYDSLFLGEQLYIESINDNLVQLERGSLIFSDSGQNGKQIGISIYNDRFYSSTVLELRIYLSSITKDKYLYSKTFQKYENNGGELFSEPIIVHSNIQNGEGIFTVESVTISIIKF